MKNVKNIWLAPLLGALMLSTSSCSERDQIKEKSNSVFVKTELVKASKNGLTHSHQRKVEF
jgi:hypothetical protein